MTIDSIRASECNVINIIIGANIKKAREGLGLTQEQLAAKLQVSDCDISRGTLAKIEIGIRDLKAAELPRFSEVLNIGIEDLYKE